MPPFSGADNKPMGRVQRSVKKRFLTEILLFVMAAASALFLPPPLHADQVSFRCVTGPTEQTVPCRVWLAPQDFHKPILGIKGGEFISVEPGGYDIRAGAPGLAMPTNRTLTVIPPVAPPYGAILHLVPGGSVAVTSAAASQSAAVEIISLVTGRVDTLFLSRERTVPFPAGKFVALGVGSPGKIIGVMRPEVVTAGDQTALTSFPPPHQGKSNVIFRIRYPGGSTGQPHDCVLQLQAGHGVLVNPQASTNKARDAYYGFFYDLPPGRYKIVLTSSKWMTSIGTITVTANTTTLNDTVTLKEKPGLKANLLFDSEIASLPRSVKVYTCREGELGPGTGTWPELDRCHLVRQATFSTDTTTITHLDPAWYFAAAEIGKLSVGHQVDLSDGNDATQLFAFHRVRLSGTVFLGDKPTAATLQFQSLDPWQDAGKTVADDEGGYVFNFWCPAPGGYQARITPSTGDFPGPAKSLFRLDTEATLQHHDFHVPATQVVVQLTDAATGAPIPGAEIYCHGDQGVEEKKTEGSYQFPALPPGKQGCLADARGYIEKRHTIDVADSSAVQTFPLALTPNSGDKKFLAVMPDGSPAGGALLFTGMPPDMVNGTGVPGNCDADGQCTVAGDPGDEEPLFLFHPGAGLMITSVGEAVGAETVTLPPAAGFLMIQLELGSQPAGEEIILAVSEGTLAVPNGILRRIGCRDAMMVGEGVEPSLNGLAPGDYHISLYSIGKGSSRSAPVLLVGPIDFSLPASAALDIALP